MVILALLKFWVIQMNQDELINMIKIVRDIPFRFTKYRDYSYLFRDNYGSCTAKHVLLYKLLSHYRIETKLLYMSFKYDKNILKFHDISYYFEPDSIYPHTMIQLYWNNNWYFIDITFDQWIYTIAPVNNDFLAPHRIKYIGKPVLFAEFSGEDRSKALGIPQNSNFSKKEKTRELEKVNSFLEHIRNENQNDIKSNFLKLKFLARRANVY